MKRCAKLFSWFGTLLVALGLPYGAFAFSINTHELLNVKAAEQSLTDRYLKEQLGFPKGLETLFGNQSATQWIRFGGAAEDQAFGSEHIGAAFRSVNHFHNPLLPWDQAGLAGRCFGLIPVSGKASARWAQDPAQGVSGQVACTPSLLPGADAAHQDGTRPGLRENVPDPRSIDAPGRRPRRPRPYAERSPLSGRRL